MQLAVVVGTATATMKHSSMAGRKLLVVQPLKANGDQPDGDPVLAVENMSAGRGDKVIITSDGQATRELLGHENSPVRWSVIGIKNSD